MSTLELENRFTLHPPLGIFFLALLCGTLSAVPLRAQDDVAEAARQARQRKAAQQNAPHHVYTEEDLKRTKILTSEDESRVISQKAKPSTPEQKKSEPQVPDTQSLGEVARRYRQEKAAREAEQAAKSKAPSRYPLDLAAPSLASAAPEVAPPSGSLRRDELNPAPPVLGRAPRSTSQISPFAPRSTVVPRNPEASLPLAVLAHSLQRERVRLGDSWWKLASRYLGKGSRWEELLRVNPGLDKNPNKLTAGTYVFVPQRSGPKTAPPGRQIVVQRGDTLWSLARAYLGCAEQWTQLAAANPQITNFTRLQIGRKLQLPARRSDGCPSGTSYLPKPL